MRIGILAVVLLLCLASLSFAVATMTANCSDITVIGDSGSYVDIEWQGPSGWGSVSGPRVIGSSGTYIYHIELNGTHRLKAGPSLYQLSLTGVSVDVTTCAPPKACTRKLDCDSGQACFNGLCGAGECSSNADCPVEKSCDASSKACVALSCICGSVANHVCVPFECCSDSNCTGGKTCVNNVCISPSSPGSSQAMSSANSAINDAQNAINSALSQGNDVSAAQSLLSQARSKFNQNDYSGAESLALQAKQSALSSQTGTGTESESSSNGEMSSATSGLFSGFGLICVGGIGLFLLAVICLFLVIALVAAFYKKK